MNTLKRRLIDLRFTIEEVSPTKAFSIQNKGGIIVDIRDENECIDGTPVNALAIKRSFLEFRIDNYVPENQPTLLIMCQSGERSLFAAESLLQLGYHDVRSIAGGFKGWKEAGLPIERRRVLSVEQQERYSRHLLIPEVGDEGQKKLLDSKVLLVGAGGLGSPAAYYLAAAGVGKIGLIDHDIVERSNLQRQILHADSRVGIPKVDSARKTLEGLNPDIEIVTHNTFLEQSNIKSLFSGYDIIIDGCDNYSTRYLINDTCVELGIANIHGSIFRFEGQVTVFWPAYESLTGPCYRCLYPEPPPTEIAPSCAEAGVLGILPGIIGLLQATECIKVLLNLGTPLIGRLLYFDALSTSFTELEIEPNAACPCCNQLLDFPDQVEYKQPLCSVS